ncbi:RluA family pseudouridine synthase [Alienimonas chondri]|uniref:Pseudouridine synthase n=1 Tax=Alienimonas chondri TaxID=2681879 RepID=A0ABX1VAC8_9PLAN|nr:RluA family pseudouridine synthase [Alienimonas chondri]NNJ24242.1 Ribosomal large subunit pseudouridine synthase D [Alienimonas chondri]
MSDAERRSLVVGPDQVGERADVALAGLFPEHSRSALQKAVKAGAVTLNDAPVKSGHRLKEGDVLSGTAPEAAAPTVPPEDLPLNVLHEDERLIVVNKAAGMIVHPGRGNPTGTLAAALQHRFDTLSDAGGEHRPGIVHRLDRDTSGVLVVAKDNRAHADLSAQFAARTVKKEYAAIARGIPGFDSDWIETHVRTDPKMRERMQVCEAGGNARSARTFYEVVERFPPKDGRGTGYTLFRLFPHTGRTHQLRVHLRYLGHPIVADNMYAGGKVLTDAEARGATEPGGRGLIRRQALHARRLEFDHPESGERVAFEAPLPTDMSRVLDALRDAR